MSNSQGQNGKNGGGKLYALVDCPKGSVSRSGRKVFSAAALQEKNTLGKKLSELRRQAGLSQKELSEELEKYGISLTAPAISRWENGSSVPNSYQLFALCSIYEVKDVLHTFLGEEYAVRMDSPELNEKGQALLADVKEALVLSELYRPEPEEKEEPEKSVITLGVFDQPAAAGSGDLVDDSDMEMMEFPASEVPEGTDFGVRISGDSMLPRYASGQIAMVQRCEELYPGQVGIFIYDGNSYIKKYAEEEPSPAEREAYTDSSGCVRKKVVLVSINPEYENVEISPYGSFHIVGRVLN